jgi:hypothetical protein
LSAELCVKNASEEMYSNFGVPPPSPTIALFMTLSITLYNADFLLSVQLGDFTVILCTDYENVPKSIIFFGKLHL